VSLVEVIRREMTGLMEIPESSMAQFQAHYDLMERWNRTLNLTTVTEVEEAAVRHYCESLYLARVLTPGHVVDVGSGPGFPGLIAAIARPDCQFDLVESHQRKAVFLREAARRLTNVRVLSQRAEAVTDSYDWTISRAVRPEDVLKLNLAQHVAVLGVEGEILPWGEKRALFIR